MADGITIKVPGPDAPGFLRRMRLFSSAQEKLQAGDHRGFVELIDLLVDFVEPDEGIDPREALEDLSRNEFEAILDQFARAGQVGNENGGS